LRELGPEAVYANTLQTFWAVAGAASASLPSVWNVRESEPWSSYFDYLAPTLRPFAYEAFNTAYAVIFVSHATRSHWAPALLRRNHRVIHNGLCLDRLSSRASIWTRDRSREALGLRNADIAVVLLGTVCERKGQRDAIGAMRLLSDAAAARVRVFIVGDRPGPYSEQLHASVGALPDRLRERVSIAPETGDPYLYLRAADVALCTSRVESYPRVILEAMAFGLPIVTTNVFGIAEQVRPEVNALFYEQAKPHDLAAQLERLVMDDAARQRMGENSVSVLRGLTQFDEMLDAYAAVFREAVGALTPTRSGA
jgi:glycosyltransferase involved in cell wall biosynthesis